MWLRFLIFIVVVCFGLDLFCFVLNVLIVLVGWVVDVDVIVAVLLNVVC